MGSSCADGSIYSCADGSELITSINVSDLQIDMDDDNAVIDATIGRCDDGMLPICADGSLLIMTEGVMPGVPLPDVQQPGEMDGLDMDWMRMQSTCMAAQCFSANQQCLSFGSAVFRRSAARILKSWPRNRRVQDEDRLPSLPAEIPRPTDVMGRWCADDSIPTCLDGSEPQVPDIQIMDAVVGSCSDGALPVCPDGIALMVPQTSGFGVMLEGEDPLTTMRMMCESSVEGGSSDAFPSGWQSDMEEGESSASRPSAVSTGAPLLASNSTPTPASSVQPRLGETQVVSLRMDLHVEDPSAFINNPDSASAIAQGITDATGEGMDVDNVEVQLSVASRRLSGKRRLQGGSVVVDAQIWTEDDAVDALSASMATISQENMAASLNLALASAGIESAVVVTSLDAEVTVIREENQIGGNSHRSFANSILPAGAAVVLVLVAGVHA